MDMGRVLVLDDRSPRADKEPLGTPEERGVFGELLGTGGRPPKRARAL